ncbi:MAG: hypothetical protein COV52_09695 [Gammaproteobacteria bacterium CG11_big_fil_rev_8_21_14_0_20_46_22]|nr:MAG: hypothetical protein COV52_09695 [Gammaproteobacteria bacterium CG11_big_fil_rev_8_21_14_0_20_46_22]
MYSEEYKNQLSLLLKILPCLKGQDGFVVKGGTAINLFYRDFPRISVDIDLTYTNIENRESTVENMNRLLNEFGALIIKRVPNAKLNKQLSKNKDYIVKLMVSDKKSIVKIEPNFVLRGTIFDANRLPVSKKVTQEFGEFIDEIPIASFNDVFAGKICAALNRQHPRDLFDIKLLFENEGITDLLRQTFVVYLACDSRPIHELLNPNYLDISSLYAREFNNMTAEPVPLNELVDVRSKLVKELLVTLTKNERNFLLSIKQGEPDYSLLPFKNLDKLPALKWKVINVRKMSKKKHVVMLNKLREVLEV